MKITHPLIPGLLIAALAVPGMAMAQSTRQVPPRPQLSDMDSNHDGKVTLREFDAAIAAGPGHQGGLAGHGKAPQTESRTPPPPSGDRQGDGRAGRRNRPRPPIWTRTMTASFRSENSTPSSPRCLRPRRGNDRMTA